MKRISVIGLGKLGLCASLCFASNGFSTIGMDIREDYVENLKNGEVPFVEANLQKLLYETRNKILFTTNLVKAITESDVTFIIVPTPSIKTGAFDNTHVLEVMAEVGPILAQKSTFHVIAVVSTVMPGSSENQFLPLLEKLSEKQVGRDFGLAYNPEFIAIGSVIHDFLNPDLVLIGESDCRTGDILQEIHVKTCNNHPYLARTNLINAEIAKLSINCFCTMKISFANNLSAICSNLTGADATDISEIIGHDSRIGQKYIKPGLGFGGPCFPRDNEAFIHFIKDVGGYTGLQQAVIDINDLQIDINIKRIVDAAQKHGPQIALLGLSYKPNTYLTERSQSLDIANELADKHPELSLRVFDPLARVNGKWTLMHRLDDCVKGANVAVILTPWPEFIDTSSWSQLLSSSSCILNVWS